MYHSLQTSKRKSERISTLDNNCHLPCCQANPFEPEEMEYLFHAIRQHHLNRIWNIFQEFEMNMDMCASELSGAKLFFPNALEIR